MKNSIKLSDVEDHFRKTVDEALSNEKVLLIDIAVKLMVDFYNNFEIESVDISRGPDYDMLLFAYGIYDLRNGKGEKYKVNLIRQFCIEDGSEEFYQLGLTLYFDKENFQEIKRTKTWSCDFENNIIDWTDFVKDMEGYKKAESIKPIFFDISLDQT